MGQRHQLFVIAKPEGQQYRSLAAVHHQWLYGMSALVTCHRLLRIFQDDANRLPIQQELAFASELFGEASEADIKALVARNDEGAAPSHVPCPFPFITTCLVVGASYDPELGKCSSVDEECFGMGYNHGDNNNGITVLDISDLGNVRYCFVDYQGMESARAVPLYTPLDGWTYLMAYFNDADDIVVNNQSTTKALEKYALVDSSALADCWPKGRWQPAMGGGRPEHGLNRKSNKMSVRSLFSLSKEKLFQELLSRESPPDLALLDQPMLIRGFAHDLQRYLIDNAEALSKSPAAIELLRKAFANETTFDFTPFQGKISAPGLVALDGGFCPKTPQT
ncbi:hypothetical protein FJTKL_12083 [Diaporthe vaccinii]|uniref:Uncharacterized protein n=1 Tax=Diaporthe vaccinii TaxID=105482 RepID=A0ABR4EF41_9PEZI